jgi:hypothetical protein
MLRHVRSNDSFTFVFVFFFSFSIGVVPAFGLLDGIKHDDGVNRSRFDDEFDYFGLSISQFPPVKELRLLRAGY